MLWITVFGMLNARTTAAELLKTVWESQPIHWRRNQNLRTKMRVAV
jgi:hypothetical protein